MYGRCGCPVPVTLLLAGLVWTPCATAVQTRVNPVQKVLSLLADMKTKGEKMMNTEEKVYLEYKEWVDDRTMDLNLEMKKANSDIEQLTAFIKKADNKIAELGREIDSLDEEIGKIEDNQKDATAIRETEHAEYEKLQKDYSESVDALQRAIQTISAQNVDRPEAEMLLQRMAKDTPGMTRVLAALLQEREGEPGAPSVSAYEFQSGGIVEMLEGLLKKFEKELSDVEEDEANKAHYYELEMVQMTDLLKHTRSDREEKAAIKSKTAAKSAKAKGDLADTQKELAEDKTLLADITATYQAKSATYAANQKVRKAELEAIVKATEIISSVPVQDSYGKHIKLLQLPSKQSAFLQLRSSKRRIDARQRAADYLQQRAGSLSSSVLQSLATAVTANPFSKVIDMIEDLLAKLKEEAEAEAEHKAWCDEQLKANKLKRNKKTTKVDELSAEIEQMTGDIENMGKEVELLLKEQADLGKSMNMATVQREKEKAANEEAIADSKLGAETVKKALVVLEEFYSAQASLVQLGSKQTPEMEEYKGMGSSSGGAVALLEVIESDFREEEANTKAAEEQAANEYKTFMAEATRDKKMKHERELKVSLEKDELEYQKTRVQKDLKAVQEELDKANEYYESLKPNCLEQKVNYEERAAKRKEEIESLKDAYDILDKK